MFSRYMVLFIVLTSAAVLSSAEDKLHNIPTVNLTSTKKNTETKNNNKQPSTAFFLNKIDDLNEQNMALEGRVEQLEYQVKQMKTSFKERYLDLDARLNNLLHIRNKQENSDSDSDSDSMIQKLSNKQTSQPLQINQIEQRRQEYKQAYKLVNQKKFDIALTALQNFLIKYPKGTFSDNAQYWIGEIFMAKHDNKNAITAFKQLINQYPSSSKIPDSNYKLARLYYQQGDEEDAKKILRSIVKLHSKSTAAKLAQNFLKIM